MERRVDLRCSCIGRRKRRTRSGESRAWFDFGLASVAEVDAGEDREGRRGLGVYGVDPGCGVFDEG